MNDDTASLTPEAPINTSGMASFKDTENMKLTPAMSQYLEIKRQHSDFLIFYRMGDFYELFFEDAITVSGALGLALTSRNKNAENGPAIPMCGVPFHAYEIHMAKLIKLGYKVAICEQMEDPAEAKKRGYKAIVRREVVRLVTPGTLTEDSLLEAKRNNYIASAHIRAKEIGLAWLDISTGNFYTQLLHITNIPAHTILSNALARLNPVEVLFDNALLEQPKFYELFSEYRNQLTIRPQALFNIESATNTLKKAYKVNSMEVFGDFSKHELIAAGVLLEYVETTQRGHFPRLAPLVHIVGKDYMEIDQTTRRSLELISPNNPDGISLLKVIDKTLTNVGGRMLAERLSAPLIDPRKINDRLDAVSFFIDNPDVRYEIREALRQCLDMERAVQRLSLGQGGPRELYDLAETLKIIPRIQTAITLFATHQHDSFYALPPKSLQELAEGFFDHSLLAENISNLLLTERKDLPALARNGNFIRSGAHAPLDYLRGIKEEHKLRCQELQQKYIDETGVSTLRVKNNSIIGYYVEVPSKSADVLLENKKFIHRQSVLNAIRFTTIELTELETEVNSAEERAIEMEQELFTELTEHAIAQANAICRTAERIGTIDIAAALAELACEYNYVRPVVDDSLDFEVKDGRHPVVEYVMKKNGSGSFVGNNCTLNAEDNKIWLLTGPNMAGKSTFLRQNALITILAQMGSYVPAQSAKIGIANKIFSRVGANDDLARGQSTFMVEMIETASILNRADERSFVILDEIGRGTATFDGLSIAWAVVEQLAEVNKCRTIFATHYHELTKLNNNLKGLTLHSMKIQEFNEDIIFMHEVINGAADRSYGIHVAKLAGLPKLCIKRAEQVLHLLEEEKQNKILTNVEEELPLFSTLKQSLKEEPKEQHKSKIEEELHTLDIDNLSPREALAKLYELKEKLGE